MPPRTRSPACAWPRREAVRGNAQSQFVLDPTPCSGGWQVKRMNNETGVLRIVVQTYTFADGACKTTPSTDADGATKVTFNGLGRIVPRIADATETLLRVDVTNSQCAKPEKSARRHQSRDADGHQAVRSRPRRRAATIRASVRV